MTKEERLADLCHKQWSGWMEYLFSKCENFTDNCDEGGCLLIPHRYVKRWGRQIATDYKDLSEKEKESDRKEARKFMGLFENEVKND